MDSNQWHRIQEDRVEGVLTLFVPCSVSHVHLELFHPLLAWDHADGQLLLKPLAPMQLAFSH